MVPKVLLRHRFTTFFRVGDGARLPVQMFWPSTSRVRHHTCPAATFAFALTCSGETASGWIRATHERTSAAS